MTIHAHTDYRCNRCATAFVPMPRLSKCPKCGSIANRVFQDFVQDAISSALFNLERYGSLIPWGWATITIGDHYYWLAFQFLSFASHQLNVAEKDLFTQKVSARVAREIAERYIGEINFGKERYRAKVYQEFFVRLLRLLPSEKLSPDKRTEKYCFLSHCISDKEFCDKLYRDLVASSIGCWYFPETAKFGKQVWGEIDENAQSCDKLIVICSKDSLRSRPVLREIDRALRREDAEGKDILLPIRVDDYVLKGWKHARRADVISKVVGDFSRWKDKRTYKRALARLVEAIRS